MKYVVLLRKVNVGTENRIDKKSLEKTFISLGYSNVETYINSGNVLFISNKSKKEIGVEISKALEGLFNAPMQFLIKTVKEMEEIADSIPPKWQNDDEQKTDIAYLFEEANYPEIINELPIKKEYAQIKYVHGAIIMNVKREYQNKSQLSKITGSKSYKYMTIRNVNTARYLAGIKE